MTETSALLPKNARFNPPLSPIQSFMVDRGIYQAILSHFDPSESTRLPPGAAITPHRFTQESLEKTLFLSSFG